MEAAQANEHADVWRRVSHKMEQHALQADITPTFADALKAHALFAWEISEAYRRTASV